MDSHHDTESWNITMFLPARLESQVHNIHIWVFCSIAQPKNMVSRHNEASQPPKRIS